MERRLVFALILIYLFEYNLYNVCNASISEQMNEQMLEKGLEVDMPTTMKSSCETLPSRIKVTKEEHDQLGNVIRVCEGSIIVNKCEGTCLSQLKPSVTTATGFLKVLKECLCCRETYMKPKEVHLTDCFDLDGKKLSDTMVVSMTEPEQCSCHKCGQ